MPNNWICSQLGAREHYAVPRALHQSGSLRALLTDAWVRPGSTLGALHRKLGDRYHPDLATIPVTSWNSGLLAFELAARARCLSGWPMTMCRNQWFQDRIVGSLARLSVDDSSPPTLFAYSYAALAPFRFAKKHGWRTVLGQIDPGPAEEKLVGRLHDENAAIGSRWVPAPAKYWQLWREECALADYIVVNSKWTKTALLEESIPKEKIAIVPLAFAPPESAQTFTRKLPAAFSSDRPLRLLFLGQVNLRKGTAVMLQAMQMLRNLPIELSVVGPSELEVPPELRDNPQIRWIGPVPRSSATEYYRQADVFLFPTFSDGFGLTQLEAQAWKLPIIASRFCGDVVEHDRNGWLLPEVTAKAVVEQVTACLRAPALLAAAADESRVTEQYTLSAVGAAFSHLILN